MLFEFPVVFTASSTISLVSSVGVTRSLDLTLWSQIRLLHVIRYLELAALLKDLSRADVSSVDSCPGPG